MCPTVSHPIPKYVYTAQIPRHKISNISAHNGIDKNAQKDYNKCGDSYETPIGFHDITFHASRQMLFNYICNPCVCMYTHTDDRADIGVSKRLLQTDLCARFNGQHLDTFL